jgi:quinol monooxygenase YgiN
MIGVLAKLVIKPGTNAAFEAAMKPIVAKVRAEPGNKLYALYRTPEDNGYLLFERYDDQAALERHRASPHYEELRRLLVDHLIARPDWQVMPEAL